MEAGFEMDNSLSIALPADSEDLSLYLETRSANSLDQNKKNMLSAFSSEVGWMHTSVTKWIIRMVYGVGHIFILPYKWGKGRQVV